MGNDASHTFDLCGGYLAIDFANTITSRHTGIPIERLTDYVALVSFAEQSGIVEPARGKQLRAWAAHSEPGEADAIVARARELREALYRLFTALADKRPPAPADLAVLNRWSLHMQLGLSFEWEWSSGADSPDSLLGPVVRSAVELLTTARRERIRTCGADDCVWLFLDTSKNGSRRWCDMNQCGNRTKARRFYRRHRDSIEET